MEQFLERTQKWKTKSLWNRADFTGANPAERGSSVAEQNPDKVKFLTEEERMAEVPYVAKIHIERKRGPLRYAQLPGESAPVAFSVHGAVAAHYGVNTADLGESHATTLDYLVAAVGG
jgi:hypothetical protein